MSDQAPVVTDQPWTGSLDLYHPRGPRVKLPILPGYDYSAAFACVSAALDAGFVVTAPGLEEGEQREEIGHVLRGEKDDGVPYVVLYSSNEALTWSILTEYLDKPEDVAAFEYASGLTLNSLPIYEGRDKPQKGHKKIVAAPKPFVAICKHNPHYREAPAGEDTRKTSEKRKRLFVRWEKTKPEANGHAAPALDQAKVIAAEQWLAGDPGLVLFNERWAMVQGDTPTQKAIRSRMVAHGARAGLTLVGKEWRKPDADALANELAEESIPF